MEVCEGTQARSEGKLLMLKSDHFFPGTIPAPGFPHHIPTET